MIAMGGRSATEEKVRPRPKRLCRQWGVNETRSTVGLCTQCRPAPAVTLEGGAVYVEGIGGLSPAAALVLAHRLADVLAP